ncbi:MULTISPECIES: hypothetical protein [Bradyrhizobium]|uniref:hypothetical protein n=1 Tax=Bradyrhizobium TaxID=374 RepID=UPI001CD77F7C|nr:MULTISPECIES: hypothetical protein [Bradyrhizobium]MCA1539951.1 hypothetical protein [Bradyrhizobium sp. NBAIM32]
MTRLPRRAKVHAALDFVDMRKGLDDLAMLVPGVLRHDPFAGSDGGDPLGNRLLLTATAKRSDFGPLAYPEDVLQRMPQWALSLAGSTSSCPGNWRPAPPSTDITRQNGRLRMAVERTDPRPQGSQ